MFQPATFRPTHSNPALCSASLVDYLASEAFQQHASQIRQDNYARARLAIALLAHIALNPSQGPEPEDHVPEAFSHLQTLHRGPEDSDGVWVYLNLYQVSNFIGGFTISKNSPELVQLMQAVSANLNSKMFKAAAMHQRMLIDFHKRMRKIDHRAQHAHQQALEQELSVRNPQPEGHWVRPSESVLEVCYSIAGEAKAKVYGPARTNLERRMESVRVLTAHPDYAGSFYEIQTALAAQYVVPGLIGNASVLQ